jgi:hypothetical protein
MTRKDDRLPPALRLEWDDVKVLLKYLKSASGALTAVVTAVPLAGLAESGLAPVSAGPPYLCVIGSVVAICLAFFGMRDTKASRITRIAWRCVWCGVGLWAFYFVLNWSFIFNKDGARVVTGWVLTPEATVEIGKCAKSGTTADLLACFGYDHAEQVWRFVWPIGVLINSTFVVASVVLAVGVFSLVMRNVALDRESALKRSHEASAASSGLIAHPA